LTQPSGSTPAATPALRTRQALTLALLFGGYAAYYFCRADLSAAMPLLVSELAERGLPRAEAVVRLGTAYSAGVLAYSPSAGSAIIGAAGAASCSGSAARPCSRSHSPLAVACRFSRSPGLATG